MFWTVTNLKGAKDLAGKLRRDGLNAKQRGNAVIVESENRPWSRLAGHMTNSTAVIPASTFKKATENL